MSFYWKTVLFNTINYFNLVQIYITHWKTMKILKYNLYAALILNVDHMEIELPYNGYTVNKALIFTIFKTVWKSNKRERSVNLENALLNALYYVSLKWMNFITFVSLLFVEKCIRCKCNVLWCTVIWAQTSKYNFHRNTKFNGFYVCPSHTLLHKSYFRQFYCCSIYFPPSTTSRFVFIINKEIIY